MNDHVRTSRAVKEKLLMCFFYVDYVEGNFHIFLVPVLNDLLISARNQFWVERWVEAYVEYIFFLAKNPRLCLQSTLSLFDEQNALLNTCCQLFLYLFSRSVQQVSKQKPKWNPLFYFDVIRTHLQIMTRLHFHTFCACPTGQGEKPNLFGPSTTEAHFHYWENLGVQSH